MAQVKFKHGTVRKSRHIVRNLISATLAMLHTINKDDLSAKGEESYMAAHDSLSIAQNALHGQVGLSQEEQVSHMEGARDALSKARMSVVATAKAHKDATSHQTNMYNSAIATIDEAKSHITSGRQFAKDRRFVPKDSGAEDEGEVANAVELVAQKDQGLL